MTTPSKSSQKPSFFHPSKIQCSSTPLKQQKGQSSGVLDMTTALKEAYDTPIRGHRFRKSSGKSRQKNLLPKKLEDHFTQEHSSPRITSPAVGCADVIGLAQKIHSGAKVSPQSDDVSSRVSRSSRSSSEKHSLSATTSETHSGMDCLPVKDNVSFFVIYYQE